MYCKKCGTQYEGNFCPNCGEPNKSDSGSAYVQPVQPPFTAPQYSVQPENKKKNASMVCLIAILAVVVIALVVRIIGGAAESKDEALITGSESKGSVVASSSVSSSIAASSNIASSQNTNMTSGQTNALGAAIQYLSFTAFSHDGLIDQLKYDQYSEEDATYAADNCGADWNEQALMAAQNYLNTTAFSYTGLIKQLEFDKFTSDQAAYGADNCGADWNEQASKAAKQYLSFQSFSKDALIEQLQYDGFTAEQAEYGVSQNGY